MPSKMAVGMTKDAAPGMIRKRIIEQRGMNIPRDILPNTLL
jgi:hypothetical protein